MLRRFRIYVPSEAYVPGWTNIRGWDAAILVARRNLSIFTDAHGMKGAPLRPVNSRAEICFGFVFLKWKIDGGRFGRQILYAARPSSYGEILIRIIGHCGSYSGTCRMRHPRQFHNDTTTGHPYVDHSEFSESVHIGWWDRAVYSDWFLQRCQHQKSNQSGDMVVEFR